MKMTGVAVVEPGLAPVEAAPAGRDRPYIGLRGHFQSRKNQSSDHSITRFSEPVQTLTRTRAVDSRFRGNDDIHGTPPQHRHSRESGNPLQLSELWDLVSQPTP
jgi:hypothetical protein